MFTFHYPATFKRDSARRILVQFPDFPRSATDGKDMAEAIEEASDCLGSAIAFCMAGKDDIPAPSALKRGQRLIGVPLYLAPKMALYMAMRERRIGNSELARRLGIRETIIRRMLDPKHDSRPDKIQAALEALGKRIVVSMDDAA